jgi:hypothetical protein
VLPTKGFPVAPGSSYAVRAVVADAGDANVDSLLMLVAGSLQLVQPPTAAAGGRYKAVGARASPAEGGGCADCWCSAAAGAGEQGGEQDGRARGVRA